MAQKYIEACEKLEIRPRELIVSFLKNSSTRLNLYGAQKELYMNRLVDKDIEALQLGLVDAHLPDFILDLSCNDLTDLSLVYLSSIVSTCPLIGLSIRGNKFTRKGAIEQLASESFLMSTTCQLQYLDLSENNFECSGTAAIMRAILNSEALHYGIYTETPYMAPKIVRARAYGYLQYLDLSNTGFGEQANLYLCDYIRSRFCGLRELRLSACQYSAIANYSTDTDEEYSGFFRFADALKRNTSLEALSLRSNRCLDNEAAVRIIRALVAEVPELDKKQDNVDNSGCLRRIEEYRHFYKLGVGPTESNPTAGPRNTESCLPVALPSKAEYDKRISELGAQASGNSMTQVAHTKLTDISVYYQEDRTSPVKVAVTPLRYLDLSCNNLCFDVAIAIADHLRNIDSVLSVLILDGVSLKNRGVNALAKALITYAPNKTILDDMAHKYIDDQGIPISNPEIEFFGCLGRTSSGIYLSLRRSSVRGQGLATLALLCRHNQLINYVAIEGCTLAPEEGESGTVNEGKQWTPDIEWEATFMARDEALKPIKCDFGLKRNGDGVLQFYKEEALILCGIYVFQNGHSL